MARRPYIPWEQLRLMLVLTLICAVSGGFLALVDRATAPRIQARAEQAVLQSLAFCLPGADEFQEVEAGPLLARMNADKEVRAVFRGFAGGVPAGVVVNLETRGYGGPVSLMVGITEDGRVARVKVLNHSETPGLGSKITEERFLEQPALRRAGREYPPALTQDGGEVQAVAGATISSRAVVRGINRALEVAGTVGEGFTAHSGSGPEENKQGNGGGDKE